MTTTLAAPVTSIALAALTPDVVRSCIVLQPSPPPEPGEEPPGAIGDDDIYTPVAPGVTYENLPEVTIVDTSPDQLIGCIIDTADNPQGRLNALFPAAIDGDGVIERSTNDIWVYDGSEWNNVGPTPGPTIVTATIIPPWNEILTYEARIRTRLLAQSLAYALQLLTEPDPLVVRTTLEAAAVTIVKAPNTALSLQSATPQVSISATVFAPAASSSITALAPAVIRRLAINMPTTDIALSGILPDLVGQFRVRVNPPAVAFDLQAIAPSVSTGVAVLPAAVTIGLSVNPVLIEAALYEVFLSSGTWDWTAAGSPSTVDVLLVAGGGGGGSRSGGGGGGAGGLRVVTGVGVTGNVTITVGSGGAGASSGGLAPGSDGGTSSFGSESAAGGGGGGEARATTDAGANGRAGGSGGGGGRQDTVNSSGGAASPSGQGNAGGIGGGGTSFGGGGGGGAGGSGGDREATSNGLAGLGGIGVTLESLGWAPGSGPATVSVGGQGGRTGASLAGGQGGGGTTPTDENGTNGASNTGGGGGGGGSAPGSVFGAGGAGGSGLVIVRWKL